MYFYSSRTLLYVLDGIAYERQAFYYMHYNHREITGNTPKNSNLLENAFKALQNKKSFEYIIFCILGAVVAVGIFVCCVQYQSIRQFDVHQSDYEWVSSNFNIGLSEQMIDSLERSGLNDVLYTSVAGDFSGQSITFSYENSNQDNYFCALNNESNTQQVEKGNAQIAVLIKGSALYNHIVPPDFDEYAFEQGNTVIMYLPDFIETSPGVYLLANTTNRNTIGSVSALITSYLHVGEYVNIFCNEDEYELKCGYIIESYDNMIQTKYDILLPGTILVSETLFKTLLDVSEIKYNTVYASLSHNIEKTVSVNELLPNLPANMKAIDYKEQQIENIGIFVIVSFLICILLLIACAVSYQLLKTKKVPLRTSNISSHEIMLMQQCRIHMLVLPYMLLGINILVISVMFIIRDLSYFHTVILESISNRFDGFYYLFPWQGFIFPQLVYLILFEAYMCWCYRKQCVSRQN